jgi:hypothetical protein
VLAEAGDELSVCFQGHCRVTLEVDE